MRKASKGKKNGPGLVPNPTGTLFEQIREVMRFHHYSLRTEKTYCAWIRRYLVFHRARDRSGPTRGWRHPKELGAAEVASFLSHLAVAGVQESVSRIWRIPRFSNKVGGFGRRPSFTVMNTRVPER